MAVGGLIVFPKYETKTPFLRTSGDDVPTNLVHTICSNDTSTSNLPTAWFEEVNNEIFVTSYERFLIYCVGVLAYAIAFCLVGFKWVTSEGGQIRELAKLVTSIILPYCDTEERKNTIVPLMMRKVAAHKKYFLHSVLSECLCMLLGVCGLMLNPARRLENSGFNAKQEFSVKLNGSEWVADCDRLVTSQDVYTLTTCRHKDGRFQSICIAPTDNIYFHLHTAIWFCFATLVVACVPILMCRIYEIWHFGLRRMNDILMLRLLRNNVGYTRHKEIIDAFASKLRERRSATVSGMRPMKLIGLTKNRDHPRKGGTQLAMPAEQCNKLSSKIPPPLEDAAVGKGTQPTSSPTSHPVASQQVTTLTNSSAPSHLNNQRPTVTFACSSTSYGGLYPGTAVTSPQRDGGQGSLISKDHRDSSHLGTMCSRVASHPCENGPFDMNVAGGPHGTIRAGVSSVSSLNTTTRLDMLTASVAGSSPGMSWAVSSLHSQLTTSYPTSGFGSNLSASITGPLLSSGVMLYF
ncbi:hypothetical protein AVEN_177005-1 [Araneus ventricosus]|uniref:Innexin n=1 Tax=Araneus ventricosus TaxID=182803 RepID=A0A4Y2PSG4_ARAVE|nr:hypothetical protein AVEN_177005-1 [Araneus ventricosus]